MQVGKEVYKLQAEVCKAIAHPLRLEVIDLLQSGELCFSDILEATGGLKSNLSQHLSVMVAGGILNIRKDSRCNYYSLSTSMVAEACSMLKNVMIESLKKQQQIQKLILQ